MSEQTDREIDEIIALLREALDRLAALDRGEYVAPPDSTACAPTAGRILYLRDVTEEPADTSTASHRTRSGRGVVGQLRGEG